MASAPLEMFIAQVLKISMVGASKQHVLKYIWLLSHFVLSESLRPHELQHVRPVGERSGRMPPLQPPFSSPYCFSGKFQDTPGECLSADASRPPPSQPFQTQGMRAP